MWINVKDRLPDKETRCYSCGQTCGERVFIVYDGKSVFVASFVKERPKLNIKNHFRKYHTHWEAKNITHWMPLPKPPKGKK